MPTGVTVSEGGRIYVTDYENNAVHRRSDGAYETIYADPGAPLRPDTLSVAADSHLYWTANQLQRLRRFNNGEDRRTRPFYLFRLPIDGTPVRLR